VEDSAAEIMLQEILARFASELVSRCKTTTFGAASAGRVLGLMASQNRFWRPTCVFLDGDTSASPGCILLPGDDAPERVVFRALKDKNWGGLADRLGRPFSDIADSCASAITLTNHHEWVRAAATKLTLSGNVLWHMMCAEWANLCLRPDEAAKISEPIEDALIKKAS
jgi:hypothetical protein